MPHVKSDAAQAATYSKRKNGLLKKGKELSILCGVEVAVICHNSRLGGPLTWSQPNRLDSVVARYRSVPVEERAKRKLDNTSLLHGQVGKMTSDLQQLADQNGKLAHHLEHAVWDERLNALAPAELEQVAAQVLNLTTKNSQPRLQFAQHSYLLSLISITSSLKLFGFSFCVCCK